MPLYRILRDTFINHDCREVKAGTVAEINWPPGTEPKYLGSNMQQARPGDVAGAKFSHADPDEDEAPVRKSKARA